MTKQEEKVLDLLNKYEPDSSTLEGTRTIKDRWLCWGFEDEEQARRDT